MRAIAIAFAFLVAGCLDDPSSPLVASQGAASRSPSTSLAPEPSPGPEVGSLSVVVTTDEIEAVSDAQVVLRGTEHRAFTDAVGTVVFNGLEPGEYTVLAAKPGYRAREEEGRVAVIEAGVTTDMKLVLNPVPVVTPETSYKETLTFRGLISCAVDSYTSVSLTFGGPTQYCGRGVTVNGQNYGRDPNDNSTHPWSVRNPQVEGWWMEASWQPSQATLADELFLTQQVNYACQVTCTGSSFFSSGGGTSPYRILVTEGSAKNITTKLGTDATKYPRPVFTLAKGFCTPSPCVAVTLNQKYDVFTTIFYGQDPPEGYSALPP